MGIEKILLALLIGAIYVQGNRVPLSALFCRSEIDEKDCDFGFLQTFGVITCGDLCLVYSIGMNREMYLGIALTVAAEE